ncbi:transcriptional antiterminator, BglG [Coriobacterium glomerans PW2]|uniref:Transcriptional antiterminator, BglG n=1 Tax=Coriobacterium glomerans (strain ATCC 49209 / DSM 20642 / JCM 10262 / PW2) TaxID=700015 RepID=F2N7H0_CORGP|nr:BglG family transcription antiterminator [Coriobacterium glomerans]AEB06786.1 transcriptional antiterminator, BglG [Coriobacterium glomerans PW2]
MSQRQRYELKLLANQGEFDVAHVADSFGVTPRTIRYDIDKLNNLLYNLNGSDAIEVRSKTARLKNDAPHLDILSLDSTAGRDIIASPLTARERTLAIISALCWSDDYVSIGDIVEEYGISRATAMRDLDRVRAYCDAHDVDLVRSRGRGLSIHADEPCRRRLIARVIRDCASIAGSRTGFALADYLRWFSRDELESIETIVREAEQKFDIVLDDTSYEAMVVHIALSVKRCKCDIEAFYTAFGPVQDNDVSTEFKMADFIVSRIEDVLGTSLPQAERYYIGVHMGARSGKVASAHSKSDLNLEFKCISAITEVAAEVGVDLTHDARLYHRLLQHISSSAYRNRVGLLLENPLRDELLGSYADHARLVAAALERSGLSQVVQMTSDEIAYVLLHFEAAIVAAEGGEVRHANVVVVCSTGIGTAELLAAELARCFEINIIASIPFHQVGDLCDEAGIDLVISTVPLQIDMPCIEVRPLLRGEDIACISNVLNQLGFKGSAKAISKSSSDPVSTISSARPLSFPVHSSDQAHEPDLGGHELSELLGGGHVFLDAQVSSWEEAVDAAGGPLVATGHISSAYVEAVIESVKRLGPYIVIWKGVALPHARDRTGVRRTSMSCVRLARPVAFGSTDNDPVRYVFMLATVDATSHTKALMSLACLLRRPSFTDLLESARSADQILSYITSFEQENVMRRREVNI